jgi:hypothetical protein
VRTQTEWEELVRTAAQGLGILDEQRKLATIDSLIVIDFVIELERLSAMEIPGEQMRAGTFASIESVATMLSQLSPT